MSDDIARYKQRLAGVALVAASLPCMAAINVGAPVTGWLPVLQGVQYDEMTPTPNDTLDLVGDSAHPLLYMRYDDNATPADTSDDEVAFRIRVAGSNGGMLKGYHWIVVDMGGDNVVDGAIGVYSDGTLPVPDLQAQFYVRTGTGDTINNTSLLFDAVPGTTQTPLVLNNSFSFLPVNATIDPLVTDVDLFNQAGNDYFVSFKFPWSYIEDSVAYYTTQGDLPPGTSIAPDTPLKMTLVSGTNHINFPGSSDFAGYPKKADKTVTWISEEALSPMLSFSTDADGDGFDDLHDNCPWDANADQLDTDSDGLGDVCDDDDDDDGELDLTDNCPLLANPDQLDTDGDLAGDECDSDDDGDTVADVSDNCPLVANQDQLDTDADGTGDACETDYDGDGVLNGDDNCPMVPNPGQDNFDGDALGDLCDDDDDDDGVYDVDDACPFGISPLDSDNDSDGCDDILEDLDDDNDTVDDLTDNCPLVPNTDQADYDGDTFGDACDDDDDNDGVDDVLDSCQFGTSPLGSDNDSDGCDDVTEDLDDDNDDVLDDAPDNCPLVYNPDQLNTDGDALGDACDDDDDNDGDLDGADNCPLLANADQADYDSDSLGDVCDTDDDNDGVMDGADSCPMGTIGTGSGPANSDNDGDGCDDLTTDSDDDNDGIPDVADNCPLVVNVDQTDTDLDGDGDACDTDDDNDGQADAVDNCPLVANISQADSDDDGLGDACDAADDGEVKTSTRGAGSIDLAFILLLAACLWLRRAQQLNAMGRCALVVVAVAGSSSAVAGNAGWNCYDKDGNEFQGCAYLGAGLGYAHLDPDTDDTGWEESGKGNAGGLVFVGYHFAPHWFVEAAYADLGEVDLENRNPLVTAEGSIDYQVPNIIAGYYFSQWHWPIDIFLKAGVAAIQNSVTSSQIEYDQENNAGLALGAGFDWRFAKHWKMRTAVESYDEDAMLAYVGVAYIFGEGKAKPVVVARPEPATAPAPEPEPEPVVQALPPAPVVTKELCEVFDGSLEGVHFKTASAELTDAARATLTKTAKILNQFPNITLSVHAHTDSQGSEEYNHELSKQRAKSVHDFFVSQGVADERMRFKGWGESRPVADNATADGRASIAGSSWCRKSSSAGSSESSGSC